jgi:hypothetical protein
LGIKDQHTRFFLTPQLLTMKTHKLLFPLFPMGALLLMASMILQLNGSAGTSTMEEKPVITSGATLQANVAEMVAPVSVFDGQPTSFQIIYLLPDSFK